MLYAINIDLVQASKHKSAHFTVVVPGACPLLCHIMYKTYIKADECYPGPSRLFRKHGPNEQREATH